MTNREDDIIKMVSQLVFNEIATGKIKTPAEIEWLTHYTMAALSGITDYILRLQEEKVTK